MMLIAAFIFGAALCISGVLLDVRPQIRSENQAIPVTISNLAVYNTSYLIEHPSVTLTLTVKAEITYPAENDIIFHVDPLRVFLTYSHRLHSRPIGFLDVPELKLDPGTENILVWGRLFVRLRYNDYWGRFVMNSVMYDTSRILFGPTLVQVNAEVAGASFLARIKKWIVPEIRFSFLRSCNGLASFTKSTFELRNCTGEPQFITRRWPYEVLSLSAFFVGVFIAFSSFLMSERRSRSHVTPGAGSQHELSRHAHESGRKLFWI
jgi:hypothetical protein